MSQVLRNFNYQSCSNGAVNYNVIIFLLITLNRGARGYSILP